MKKYLLLFLLWGVFGNAQYNLFARQNFAHKAVSNGTNTEIGGIASTISTPALLASKLGISVSAISNFTIVGSDIKCKITGSYGLPNAAFAAYSSTPNCTYYYDYDNLVNSIAGEVFDRAANLFEIKLKGVVNIIDNGQFRGTKVKIFDFPNLTSITGLNNFSDFSPNFGLITNIYIPNTTTLGATAGNDGVFGGMTGSPIIYVNPYLATNNAGSPDGDLTAAIYSGSTIRYVTNFTAPNTITDLSAGTIYNTAIQLNFTPPSSTNAIDYYECYANGVLKNTITGSGEYITGLTTSTNYNITVIAVDIFYNKSIVSNNVNQSSNTTSAVPIAGLVSYYKLDSNSNDSFGSNNGTDTAISYVAGKVNNAASFNGTTSTIVKASSSFDFFGSQNLSFSFWFKATSMPASVIDLISVQEVGTPATIDKTIRLHSNGSVSFYCYDGAVKVAQSAAALVTIGNWYHVVGVFDGSNVKVYLNGALRATTACTGSFNFTAPQLTFGKSAAGVLNGLIDETQIYNTAKTQVEIDLLYNSGIGTTL